MNEPSLWIRLDPHRAVFRVRGKGSFQNAPTLKEAAGRALDEKGVRSLAFDLSDCAGMDSTFLGVLASLANRVRQAGGELVLAGATARNQELIENMGLNRLVNVQPDGVAGDELGAAGSDMPVPPRAPNKAETTRIMIEAHETLAQIDERNKTRFQDVLDYLRRSESTPPSGAAPAP